MALSSAPRQVHWGSAAGKIIVLVSRTCYQCTICHEGNVGLDVEMVEISSHQHTICHCLEELEYWSSFTRNNCLRSDTICAIWIKNKVPGLLKGVMRRQRQRQFDSRIDDPDWDPLVLRALSCRMKESGEIRCHLRWLNHHQMR